MIDHDEAKIAVLEDLMEKMREMDGGRLKPKAVEVSMESVKPGPGIELHDDPEAEPALPDEVPAHGLDPHGAQPGLALEGGEHQEPDSDEELSPEDLAILDQLFGGKESEEEQC